MWGRLKMGALFRGTLVDNTMENSTANRPRVRHRQCGDGSSTVMVPELGKLGTVYPRFVGNFREEIMDRFIALCPLSLIFYFYQTKGVTFRSPLERDSIPLCILLILSRGKPLRFNARNYMKQNCNIPKSPCGHFKHRIGGQWFFYALSLLLSHFMDIIEECVKSGTESIFSINRG